MVLKFCIMKASKIFTFIGLMLVLAIPYSCSDDNDSDSQSDPTVLSTAEKSDLIFMMEEEKMARDVYSYLGNLWNSNVFANIQTSEQSHMDAVEKLLNYYNVSYSNEAPGIFNNSDLQMTYDQLIEIGEVSIQNAMVVGATIEDLDINDLFINMENTNNSIILKVYNFLQCGSKNHLRSFNNQLELMSYTYTPQYISESYFKSIIESTNESCNN